MEEGERKRNIHAKETLIGCFPLPSPLNPLPLTKAVCLLSMNLSLFNWDLHDNKDPATQISIALVAVGNH